MPEITEPHLEEIIAVLTTLYHKGQAEDLLDNYRKCSARNNASALTKAIEDVLEKTKSYSAK